MIRDIIEDLRQLAQKCTSSARDCQTYPLSVILEELGIDLMAKARELEQKFGQ
jgi:hypothetical protein